MKYRQAPRAPCVRPGPGNLFQLPPPHPPFSPHCSYQFAEHAKKKFPSVARLSVVDGETFLINLLCSSVFFLSDLMQYLTVSRKLFRSRLVLSSNCHTLTAVRE